jgi:hypothetical protein
VFVIAGLVAVDAQSPGSDWTVLLRRIGPLPFGSSIADVRRLIDDQKAYLVQALRQRQALPREPDDAPCGYLATTKTPQQIGLMFQNGRLVRADIWEPGIQTASGAQVGDSEPRIVGLYGSRIDVRQHHYRPAGAHYLVYSPADALDREYQLLFETDGAKVTQFRAGLRTAVEQVEGCG